jgi:hypothetical protein
MISSVNAFILTGYLSTTIQHTAALGKSEIPGGSTLLQIAVELWHLIGLSVLLRQIVLWVCH